MTLIPELERQLVKLAGDHRLTTSAPARSRRRWFRGAGTIALAFSSVVAIGVALTAVALLGHGPHATSGVTSRSPGAAPSRSAPSATALDGSQAQPLLSILEVLRRPQTATDRVSQARRLAMQIRTGTPVISLMRLATIAPWGTKVFVVPVRYPGQPAQTGLALLAGRAGCCSTAAQIQAGDDWSNSGPSRSLVIVVPDGVARVEIRLTRSPASHQSKTIAATVHNNIAALLTPSPIENLGIDQMTWYGPSGKVITRPRPPRSAPTDPIIKDCLSHARLTGSYSTAQLERALDVMSMAVKEYTPCVPIISIALARNRSTGR